MTKPPRRSDRRGGVVSARNEAQTQLAEFIDKYDPKIAALARKVLAHMNRRLPGAVCMVYDNYNALAIGFGPLEKVSAIPLSIALYPRWINLFFLMGITLDDPNRLLKGAGARVRSIRINQLADIKDPNVDALITAAVMQANWELQPKAKNTVIIRSVSPNQRPRRP